MKTTLPRGAARMVGRRLTPEPERQLPTDPVAWVRDELDEYLWSVQRQIMQAVVEHRKVAVQSCHQIGKSYIASRIGAWWIAAHPPGEAMLVSTAPSQPQVRSILWKELQRAHSRGRLPGTVTRGAVPEWTIAGEQVGFGRKPADYVDADQARTQFQGIHARYLLGLIDEGCGVPVWLWQAMDTLATNESSRLLAIGNPDDPTTEFAKKCAPGSGWHVIKVSAFDTPNFTDENVPEQLRESLISPLWVEEVAKDYGVDSAYYISKVLGEFPEVADDVIISPKLIREAHERDRSGHAITDTGRYGMDVARMGCHDDQTELLTDRGWRAFADVKGDERVLSRHMDGTAAWEPITERHSYRHVGPMALYDGERLNFCVTENHRMLAAPACQGSRERPAEPTYGLRRWEECAQEFIAPRQVEWQGHDPGDFLFESVLTMPHGGEREKRWRFEAPDWFAFLGWFISEGCVYHERRKRGRRRVLIAQSGAHMAAIRALLDRMGIKHRLASGGKQVEFSIRAIADHLDTECGSGAASKRIPRYVLDAPAALIETFLDAYCDGDGSRRDGHRQSYATTSPEIADGLQEMLVKLGRAGTLSTAAVAGSQATIEGRTITRGYDVLTVTEAKRVRYATIAKRRARTVSYDGYVYCVSTPHHTILTRRNGCVLWAGNSDETAIYFNRGGMIRLTEAWRKEDTDVSRRKAQAILDGHSGHVPMQVDVVGLGAGVYDPLKGAGYRVTPFSGGERANNADRYVNRNAEAWWAFREGLEAGLIDLDPEDETLAAQLQSRKWKHDSSQRRIEVESKDKMRERGIKSPDRADAAVMAYYQAAVTIDDPAEVLRHAAGEELTVTGDLLTLKT